MTGYPETRASLIIQVKDPENQEAWQEFVAIYQPVIYRTAISRGLQDADAHDLSQQVLTAVAGAINRWEPNSRFRHWLRRITRNAILNALNRRPLEFSEATLATEQILNETPERDSNIESLINLEYRRELFLRAVDDATMTRSGVIAGTPQYMSPEQARGEAIDSSSDLFSLGSVIYTMCTGQVPFAAETTFGVLQRINGEHPIPIRQINSEIPRWLCDIVDTLMAKQSSERFESAEAVATLLENCLAHIQQPDIVTLPANISPSRNFSFPRNKQIGILTMIAIASFVLTGFLILMQNNPYDISGTWHGENWNVVELRQTNPGEYEGTCTLPAGQTRTEDGEYNATAPAKHQTGFIKLKWSRVFNRYMGTWGQKSVGENSLDRKNSGDGQRKFGKISLRLVNDQIHGACTTNSLADVDATIPPLGGFVWHRKQLARQNVLPASGNEQNLSNAANQESRVVDSLRLKQRELEQIVEQTRAVVKQKAAGIESTKRLVERGFRPKQDLTSAIAAFEQAELQLALSELRLKTHVDSNHESKVSTNDTDNRKQLRGKIVATSHRPDNPQTRQSPRLLVETSDPEIASLQIGRIFNPA